MKTYLFDLFNKYKKYSDSLDVQTILCSKSWWVFNDSGEKETYIFQEDGSLIISLSGKVTNASWKFIPVNKSLIISSSDQSYMLHPSFIDSNILSLQKDGTDEYSFLIDESQKALFAPKSFKDITNYFIEKEIKVLKAIEANKMEKEARQKEQELNSQRIAKERELKLQQEIEEKRHTDFINKKIDEILNKDLHLKELGHKLEKLERAPKDIAEITGIITGIIILILIGHYSGPTSDLYRNIVVAVTMIVAICESAIIRVFIRWKLKTSKNMLENEIRLYKEHVSQQIRNEC